jgi:hypothetical protein
MMHRQSGEQTAAAAVTDELRLGDSGRANRIEVFGVR